MNRYTVNITENGYIINNHHANLPLCLLTLTAFFEEYFRYLLTGGLILSILHSSENSAVVRLPDVNSKF